MNKVEVILYKHPLASIHDFSVVDYGDGMQLLMGWNVKDEQGNPIPEPTEEDLVAWNDEMLANPKSQEPTVDDRIAALEFTILQQLGL